jgi:hypothetical protein
MASRNSTLLHWTLLYKHFARTTQKTQPLYCWEGVFTASLHSKGSYAIVACVFVAAGMCLPSRCVTMNVYSVFTIPAFGLHVTISWHTTHRPIYAHIHESTSWETKGHSVNHEMSRLLWNPKVHYLIHKSQPLGFINTYTNTCTYTPNGKTVARASSSW